MSARHAVGAPRRRRRRRPPPAGRPGQRRAQAAQAAATGRWSSSSPATGKGKSTSAFGMLLRSWARGYRCGVFQFVKSGKWKVGEAKAAAALGGIDWEKMGDGWSWLSKDLEESADKAREGWAGVKRMIAEERYEFLLLDEITYPIKWGWIDAASVVATLLGRPGFQHVVITGRDAAPELIEAADLVSEVVARQAPDGRRASGPSRGSSGSGSWSSSTARASRSAAGADVASSGAHPGARRPRAAAGARAAGTVAPACPAGSETAIPVAARLGRRPRRSTAARMEAAARGSRSSPASGRGASTSWPAPGEPASPTPSPQPARLADAAPAHAVHRLAGHRLLLVGPAPPPAARSAPTCAYGPSGAPRARAHLRHGRDRRAGRRPPASARAARRPRGRAARGDRPTPGTDLCAKRRAAIEAIEEGAARVVVHVGAPDEAAHERDAAAKVAEIERADAQLIAPLAASRRRDRRHAGASAPTTAATRPPARTTATRSRGCGGRPPRVTASASPSGPSPARSVTELCVAVPA